MTIVRELVTRLAFQVDQSGVNKFNQTVSGFRLGLEGIASQAFSIADKVVSFFNGVSSEITSVRDISVQANIAVERFAALREAAGEFNIKPQQFDQAFVRLNELLQQAAYGQGELFRLANSTSVEFRDLNGNLINTEELFINIVDYLSKIGDDFHRQRVAVNIFGQEIGPRIAEAATQGGDAISNAAEKYAEFGRKLAEGRDEALAYEKTLNELTSSARQVGQTLGIKLFPFISSIFKSANSLLTGKAPLSAEQVEEYRLSNDSRVESLARIGIATPSSANNTTNNITIEVSPTTTEGQAQDIADATMTALKSFQQEEVRELMNNNPQVE
jgi:hypothetical protein